MPDHAEEKLAYEPPAVMDRVPIDAVFQVQASSPNT
jgi:hypothetical protein